MKYFNMLDIRFSQIQVFLAVAEVENITAAARSLHMTQSAVSKTIKYMEDTLGLYLFIRDRQTLRLTPAGRLLKDELAAVWKMTQNALERAHAMQTGRRKPALIGIPDSSDYQKIFINTKKLLQAQQIESSLHIECLPFNELGPGLLNGLIDIVITCGFDRDSYAETDFAILSVPVGCYYAYMDQANPLSSRDSIRMEELKSAPFFVMSPMFTPTYEQLVLKLCQQAGFQPLISRYLLSPNAFACNFDTGMEVFLADGYMREIDNPQLVKVPIEQTESSMLFIRRKTEQEPFVTYLHEEIARCWRDGCGG